MHALFAEKHSGNKLVWAGWTGPDWAGRAKQDWPGLGFGVRLCVARPAGPKRLGGAWLGPGCWAGLGWMGCAGVRLVRDELRSSRPNWAY